MAHPGRAEAATAAWRATHAAHLKIQRAAQYKANAEKIKAEKRAAYKLDSEKAKAATRKWAKANPEKAKAATKAWRYKKFEKLAGRPRPGKCDICKVPCVEVCFDHCHKTNKFRGWLCHRCNRVLGYVQDKPKLLRKLADYLEAAKRKR